MRKIKLNEKSEKTEDKLNDLKLRILASRNIHTELSDWRPVVLLQRMKLLEEMLNELNSEIIRKDLLNNSEGFKNSLERIIENYSACFNLSSDRSISTIPKITIDIIRNYYISLLQEFESARAQELQNSENIRYIRKIISEQRDRTALSDLIGDIDALEIILNSENLDSESLSRIAEDLRAGISLLDEELDEKPEGSLDAANCEKNIQYFKKIKLATALKLLRKPELLNNIHWRSIISAISTNLERAEIPFELQSEIMFNFLESYKLSTERLKVLVNESIHDNVEQIERELISEFVYIYYTIDSGKIILDKAKIVQDFDKKGIKL